ncbi:alpha/beta fold hydrolase [Saccharopolyspora shandongensis]|uniref:thioesterase II family protein n=1 Tax=Saccharopolyspora shandongensis TaxID=418495 RepID=UPI0033E56E69
MPDIPVPAPRVKTATPSLWPLTSHPSPKLNLVCFPHAGGNADFFAKWPANAVSGVQIHAVEYPGRGRRRDEPAAAEICPLADEIASHILALPSVPLVLFGHSMGSVVAFEVARRLADVESAPPHALVVSNITAPHRLHRRDPLPVTDDGVWEHSYSIGGIPKPIYRSRVLKNMMAPTLRADYEMLNRYRCDPSPQISCPVTVLHSDGDVLTTLDDASAWNELTVGTYSYRGFTGGHFYLTEQEALVARLVSELGIGHTAEELRTAVPLQRETSSADRTHTIEPVH